MLVCYGLGREGVAWWCGGTVWNTIKDGGTETREQEVKILKRRNKLGQEMDALKRGGGGSGTPLRNYDVYIYIVAEK